MKITLVFLLSVSAVLLPRACIGNKIVVIYSVATKSHIIAFLPVIEELAKRGHEVTFFTPYANVSASIPNCREIFLEGLADQLRKSLLDWFGIQKGGPAQIVATFPWIIDMLKQASEEIFSHPKFLEIVNERSVDLFLVDAYFSDYLYPVFDRISVPFVAHYATSISPRMLRMMGAPIDYASVPTPPTEFDNKMTFGQRVANLVFSEIFYLVQNHYILKSVEHVVEKHFPGAKSMSEVAGDASILIVNSHPVTSWPRSLPPTIVPIGAIHTRPPKALPQELQDFSDAATEGLIIFTLGSMVPVSHMPKETVETFIRVFSKLPQRIIWKWEADEKPNISPNIKLVKWLPQQDLLGHPNTKVFISHGGMLGTQEAAYHGVPILGLPFGNDHHGNIGMAVRSGWGYKLNWDTMKDGDLHEALLYLIYNPSVRANATKVSRLMRDEIMPGKDVAVYWIEYVLRHGGTKHLQLAAKNLSFYKLYFIDAIVLLLLFMLGFVTISFYAARSLFRHLIQKRDKPKLM